MELDIRALSPSQLAEELGSDLNHVSRCFRQLETWGLAEVVEVRPDRRRGVAVEHVYRGVPRVHIAAPTSKRFPLECKKASSAAFLRSYLDPIDSALAAGTFDEDPERNFGWDEVLLDAIAWTQLLERLAEVSRLLLELALARPGRNAEEGDEQIPTTLGLAASPTAQPAEAILGLPPREYAVTPQSRSRHDVVGAAIAKALSNPCRGRILAELSWRPMSPSHFVEELGGDISYVARCFRQLASWGFLEVAEERRGGRNGGGVERIFRNSQRAYFGAPVWEGLPRRVREELTSFSALQYARSISQAIEAEVLRREVDRFLWWEDLILNRTAWSDVGSQLDDLLLWLPKLEAESRWRCGPEIEALKPAVVQLACFRSG